MAFRKVSFYYYPSVRYYNLYNKWIEDNHVGEYLDLSNPMYTPGRHQLGQCISHDFKHPEEFVQGIINNTGKINSFFITDDQNKTIL